MKKVILQSVIALVFIGSVFAQKTASQPKILEGIVFVKLCIA